MARFDPQPGDKLSFQISQRDFSFEVVEHPNAPGEVHAMEGGKATVFHLRQTRPSGSEYALKVMRPLHRDPLLVDVCKHLDPLKQRSGFMVCERLCLSPAEASSVLQRFPELEYGILMPWIKKLSWFDAVQQGRKGALLFSQGESLHLGLNLLGILWRLEQDGMAHCDLSGANMLFDPYTFQVELIDVEDMYLPALRSPKAEPAGTPGYQHKTSGNGQWRVDGDRFAGAVLLAEIFGWYDEEVRRNAFGESYFEPAELQEPSSFRLTVLKRALARHNPALPDLLDRAWRSPGFSDSPSFGEWWKVCTPFVTVEPAEQQQAPVRWETPTQTTAPGPAVSWSPVPASSSQAPVHWDNGTPPTGAGDPN